MPRLAPDRSLPVEYATGDWLVIGTHRDGRRVVLEECQSKTAAEVRRRLYAAHLEGYSSLAVERATVASTGGVKGESDE